jgi:hypothetical protein
MWEGMGIILLYLKKVNTFLQVYVKINSNCLDVGVGGDICTDRQQKAKG